MTTSGRWRRAQEYEQGFWEGVARKAAEGSYGQIDFYGWRASEVERRLRELGLESFLDGCARAVELGSGPVGVLGFLPAAQKVAVDPLNRYYASNEHLAKLRNKEVQYIEAPGESVPLDSGSADLVIMENCIDHVRDVDAVMAEIRRLLRSGGVLYLTVNARSGPGYWIHRALARLELDPGHPHTFTARRFRTLLLRHGFDLLRFESGSWWDAWRRDLIGSTWKARAKGLLLVSEHLLTAVARLRED